MGLKNHKQELGFLFFVIALLIIWLLGKTYNIDPAVIQNSLQKFPIFFSAIIYIVLYVVVTFFIFFSKDIFWLVGAVVFGVVLSTLFICIAEVVNAFILFHFSRNLGRDYVQKQLLVKYKYLDEKLGRVNFFWLFIFRAAPLVPYRFLDLAAGLTSIKFSKYLTAVILGSPLKMFWVQYILAGVGYAILKNPEELVKYFLNDRTLFMFSFIYVILVIVLVIKLKHKGKLLCQ